jgi:hypothetical protein
MKYLKPWFLAVAAMLIFLSAEEALACSCVWGGPFMKVAPASTLVVRGRILRHTGAHPEAKEMEIQVLEIISGRTEKRVITISGDNGLLCRPYVSGFPVGTEWILALSAAEQSFQDKGDYAISICGTYWLKVSKGRVSGNIHSAKNREARQQLSLREFRRRFKAMKKGASFKCPVETRTVTAAAR